MKRLPFLLIIIFLFACESNREYNFSCDCKYTFQYLDGNCQWTMTRIGFAHDNKTYDEIREYEASQKPKRYFLMYGQMWRVSGDCHCMPYECPEYDN